MVLPIRYLNLPRTQKIASKVTATQDKEYPEITKQLAKELLDWLQSVHANMPSPDPEYDSIQRLQYEAFIKNKKWPNLEKQRKNMLSEDFKPNKNWWGSKVTKD